MVGNVLKRFEEMNKFMNTEESNSIAEIESLREVMKTTYTIVRQEYDKALVRKQENGVGMVLTLVEQLFELMGEEALTEMLASAYLGVDTKAGKGIEVEITEKSAGKAPQVKTKLKKK